MAKIDLSVYGINGSTVIAHNPSYEELFKEETKAGLTGYDKGQETELGVKHEYDDDAPGAHDLVTWRHLLYYHFLPGLWRNNYKWK